jgi:hypothetical protein
LATIDFSRTDFGPHAHEAWRPMAAPGCQERGLIACQYFELREQRVRGSVEQPVGDKVVEQGAVGADGELGAVAQLEAAHAARRPAGDEDARAVTVPSGRSRVPSRSVATSRIAAVMAESLQQGAREGREGAALQDKCGAQQGSRGVRQARGGEPVGAPPLGRLDERQPHFR